jgi:hypothetical protein
MFENHGLTELRARKFLFLALTPLTYNDSELQMGRANDQLTQIRGEGVGSNGGAPGWRSLYA